MEAQIDRLQDDYFQGRDWIDLEDPSVTRDHVRKWRVLSELKVQNNGMRIRANSLTPKTSMWAVNFRLHSDADTLMICAAAGQERNSFLQVVAGQLHFYSPHRLHTDSGVGMPQLSPYVSETAWHVLQLERSRRYGQSPVHLFAIVHPMSLSPSTAISTTMHDCVYVR